MNKKNYCIVGYGSHAKNKIIPQLIKIKNFRIVSSKKLPIKNFNNLDDAISHSNKNTVFIIVPPQFHSKQSKKILNSFKCIYRKTYFYKY